MSKIIMLSNKENIITNKVSGNIYPSYSFVRYLLGDKPEIDQEFARLQKKFGLKFFSLFIVNQQTKIKYYFSSAPAWNDYYIKYNLITINNL